MEENEKIHNAKIKSQLVNVTEVYFWALEDFFPWTLYGKKEL